MDRAKPYDIPKREVWEAYKRVRANQGAAGVDGQMISDFEADLENNLYKLWNRLSSGSYFPPPVRRVDIPKSDGRMRPLGIPTVADRIAQMVVKRHLEPLVEPQFHPDSYGYSSSSRPSVVGRCTSIICIAANFSSTLRGVSPGASACRRRRVTCRQ
jgi:RNA-directed DNA polymerase